MKRILCILLTALLLASSALAAQSVNITFTGDVTLGSEELKRKSDLSFVGVAKNKGYDWFFANYVDMFRSDDLTVINFEGTLTDSNKQENKKKTYRFRGDTDFVKILTSSGIEAANLANNHSQDFGTQGYNSTKDVLKAAGVGYFGNKAYWVFDNGNGIRIAFFGQNSTKMNGNKKWMKDEVARLKIQEGVNAAVFVFHGGTEYGRVHTKAQQNYAEQMIDAGFDLVIMHHPHVVQGLAVYRNRYICYSLGNFCFGGNSEVRALETVVAGVRMDFDDEGNYIGQQLTLYPAHISGDAQRNTYQPHPVTGDEARAVMALIQHDTDFELAPYSDETQSAPQPYLPAQETTDEDEETLRVPGLE